MTVHQLYFVQIKLKLFKLSLNTTELEPKDKNEYRSTFLPSGQTFNKVDFLIKFCGLLFSAWIWSISDTFYVCVVSSLHGRTCSFLLSPLNHLKYHKIFISFFKRPNKYQIVSILCKKM